MKIAIIGAGNVGRALATASVRAGHTVSITSAIPGEAEGVAAEVGATPAPSNSAAVADAEVVILAVPFDAVRGIVEELGSALDGKILIDVTNRFAPEQLDGTSNAELTQEMAPNARVVKAFNTIFAARQTDPRIDGIQLDGFVEERRRTGEAHRARACRLAGLSPDRRWAPDDGAGAGGHGAAQHQLQHARRLVVAERLEAARPHRCGCR